MDSKKRLLLADDSITVRKVVELTFRDEGFDVIAVDSGEAAMQSFVENQPDIVMVDATLQGTSGTRICEMIKHDEATKSVPVILLIGAFEPFNEAEAVRVRADAVVKKPFHSIRDLVAQVHALLADTSKEDGSEAEETKELPAINPDTEDIDELYRSCFVEPSRTESFEAADDDITLGDAALDDGLIEASYLQSEGATDQNDNASVPSSVAAMSQEQKTGTSGQGAVSEDVIEEIVRRVIDRMSDQAVRDVAREAVPRITEKLIREALEEERRR
jgi:DNA-binding response OmpR family regulator